ncbi:hypothetical protein HK097_004625 [Rhizophlyctis rosea]|uniref:L-ornithine N(5)-oxygenase n=1 Tax=Rhizophlyctis rosea TaxID=64517 RepID=A0AAD5SFW9_9FUNG|nr:hypothetical protein HK097_004625 [Rhizophlyctis rosea]
MWNMDIAGLREYAGATNRTLEIKEIPNFINQTHRRCRRRACNQSFSHSQHTKFHLPSSSLFIDYCNHLVNAHDLERLIQKGKVIELQPANVQEPNSGFIVSISDGSTLQTVYAKHVVCAIGHGNTLRYPGWVHRAIPPSGVIPWPKDRLLHSSKLVDHNLLGNTHSQPSTIPSNNNLLVVGGGLTSGHLLKYAQQKFTHTLFTTRSNLRTKHFDVSLDWISQNGAALYASFYQKTPEERWNMIQTAREGGSINPPMAEWIRNAQKEGWLGVKERVHVTQAIWRPDQELFEIHLSDQTIEFVHSIWLSTGTTIDVNEDALFRNLLTSIPIETFNGYPCLTKDLRWHPDYPLYVMGGYAALEVGPNALNLAGGKIAAEIIAGNLESEWEDDVDIDLQQGISGNCLNMYDILSQE